MTISKYVLKHAKGAILSIFTIFVAICALGTTTDFAYATPGEDKQAEADAAYEQLTSLQAELDAAEASYGQALEEQEAAEAKVEEAEARIVEITAQIEDLQDKLATRACAMYMGGSLSYLDVFFGCASWAEFTTTWDLLNALNQNDADMVSETKALRQEAEEQKIVLEEQAAIAEEKAEVARQIKEDAEATVAEVQEIYDNLSEEAAELLAEEQAAAEAAAAAAAQAAIDNSNSGGSSSGGSYNNSYSGRADAGSTVGRAYAILNEGDCYYSWGGVGPYGFDCSGFVSYCLTGSYSRLGTTYTFLNWTQVSDPQPGDVCVNSGHCGIYIGGGQMIHAASPGQGICVGGVQSGMIYVRY